MIRKIFGWILFASGIWWVISFFITLVAGSGVSIVGLVLAGLSFWGWYKLVRPWRDIIEASKKKP